MPRPYLWYHPTDRYRIFDEDVTPRDEARAMGYMPKHELPAAAPKPSSVPDVAAHVPVEWVWVLAMAPLLDVLEKGKRAGGDLKIVVANVADTVPEDIDGMQHYAHRRVADWLNVGYDTDRAEIIARGREKAVETPT